MAESRVTRKLAAILAADMVGFSRLIGADEAETIARQKAHRRELIDPKIAEHNGRIVKTTGDGLLVEFGSAVDAVLCADEIQRAITAREADVPKERRIAYRCGINLGEIVIDGDDILGEGVNVAARLQVLAEPGGIRISDTVFKNVKGKLDLGFADLGPQKVKNIAEPVPTYRVLLDPADVGKLVKANPIRLAGWRWPALAAAVVLMLSVASVTWWRPWVPKVEPASVERMAFPLPDKPSIAVLPFANLTGDPKQDHVADGMTETIISTLSKIPELFVISRNSSFTYKGKAVKVQQVAEELGVKYVLEGSLQQAAENIRITVQLIDALKGNHLWSENYDRKFEDLFKLQDEIALKTTIALQVKLTTGEEARVLSRTTNNVRAWTLYQQALTNFFKFSAEGNREARRFAEKALSQDPEFADAMIVIGFTHLHAARMGFSRSSEESLNLAIEYAEKARAIAPDAPNFYNLMQAIYRYKGEFDKAIATGERAIELSPNSDISLQATAMTTHLAGQFDLSIELAKKTIRQSPHHRSTGLQFLSRSLWFKREYQKAINAAKEGLERAESPIVSAVHLLNLAISYVELGEMDKARRAVREAQGKWPQLNLTLFRAIYHYQKVSDWRRIESALRSAGLPE